MDSTDDRHRRQQELRALLRPYARPSYLRGLSLVVLDLALFCAAAGAVVGLTSLLAKLAASALLGLSMARMFVLGHDAVHGSLTPSRRLNGWLARLLFLPTLTPPSIWRAGHNVAHHGFAMLRGRDIPWVPLSPAAYAAQSPARRWRYRVYRSAWGAGLYYGIDVWWRLLIFPAGKVRPIYRVESTVVTAFAIAQTAVFAWAALRTGQSPLLLVLLGVALPFVLWLYVAAIVFYVHHTERAARWFDDPKEWRAAQPNLDATYGTQLPLRLDALLHHVMEHTAHHANAAIPCYRLAAAQRTLEAHFPMAVPRRRMSLQHYVATTRHCQLYDSALQTWVSFRQATASNWPRVTVESLQSVSPLPHPTKTTKALS